MEVETQSLSTTFDPLNTTTPPFSYSIHDLGMSSLDLADEMPDSPSVDVFSANYSSSDSPVSADLKCDGLQMHFTVKGSDDLPENGAKSTMIDGGDEFRPTDNMTEPKAAVKLQKVYRSYRTRRRLADSAVVAEELWWQAIDYARLNHSTVSFFNFLKPESAASRWNRISLNASKVGKGLSKDAKAQKLAFQHWIEAIDPQHRYGHNLHLYYEEWCKADAGQPFFYWLDVGDGKDVNLEVCSRSKLRKQSIKYLGPQEREHYEYIVVEGKIINKQSGDFLDTNKGSQGTKWIFVMSTAKKLYAGEKKKGLFHHSSFLAGGATLAAGRLDSEGGVLKTISAYSGHYRPTDDSLDCFLSFLKEEGVNLDEVQIRKANEESESYDDVKSSEGEVGDVLTNSQTPEVEIDGEDEKAPPSLESAYSLQMETKIEYKRTLSGGLQSPRADVPKNAILQRINSKKTVKSYQLGHQISLKWTTGAGPRIGCVADYPVEVRVQALEFVNLSPRFAPTPRSYKPIVDLASPIARTSDLRDGNGTSAD